MKSPSLWNKLHRAGARLALLSILSAAAGLGGCADQHHTTALRSAARVNATLPRYYDDALGSYYYADNFGPYYGGFGPYYDDYDPFIGFGYGYGGGAFRHGGYYGGHHFYGGSFGRGGGHFGGGGHTHGGGGHHR
jgi:hypothetical protein